MRLKIPTTHTEEKGEKMGCLEAQFAEPHQWWDEYDERRHAEYSALVRGKTCLDCAKCERCDRHSDTGFCKEDGEFRYSDDRPGEMGLECFVSAA